MEKQQNEIFFETKDLTKKFGDVTAVNHVSMAIRTGEIRGLIGENGSGKSTISSMISAIHTVTGGEMFLYGKPYSPKNPGDARKCGITMIVQEAGTIDGLSIAENIFVGDEKRFAHHGIIDRAEMNREAVKALENIGVTDVDVTRPAAAYSLETRKLVEVAKALYYDPILFIVDETTTALSQSGRKTIYRIIHELRDKGKAVLFISHDLEELMENCDVLTVLRDGKLVDTIERAEFDENRIKHSMVGREIKGDYYRSDYDSSHGEKVTLQAEHISNRDLKDVSVTLHEGEILGVAGLVGAQRTELMEGIFGLRAHTAGKVWIKGQEVAIKQPRDAIQHSVALLTEDRRATGIMGVLSVADNISIASLDALRKGPIMLDDKKILELVATNKEKMAIKVPSPKTAIKSLSGGNQQKVLIARWLANNPDVLILDEPTRGIDVGAKYEIYCIIADLAKQGKSIIMISSEMSEIIGMSNRVMVMCDGRITGFINGKDATQENIMALATQFETAPDAAAANQ